MDARLRRSDGFRACGVGMTSHLPRGAAGCRMGVGCGHLAAAAALELPWRAGLRSSTAGYRVGSPGAGFCAGSWVAVAASVRQVHPCETTRRTIGCLVGAACAAVKLLGSLEENAASHRSSGVGATAAGRCCGVVLCIH